MPSQLQFYPGAISAANTAKDGTGTVARVFTADASASFVYKLRFQPLGTNVATVARVFVNNGGPNSDATNNALIAEKTLPATTLDEAAAFAEQVLTLNVDLPIGYRLYVTLGTAVAAGFHVSAYAGPTYAAAFINRSL